MRRAPREVDAPAWLRSGPPITLEGIAGAPHRRRRPPAAYREAAERAARVEEERWTQMSLLEREAMEKA